MFVEEMAGLFSGFDTDEQRECLRGDLAELGADRAAREFAQAEKILGDYVNAAEHGSGPL